MNVSSRSYKPFNFKFVELTYLTLISLVFLLGIIQPSYKSLLKGEDYNRQFFLMELIASLSFFSYLLFLFDFYNTLILYFFFLKPVFEVLKIIFNEFYENGNYYVLATFFLTLEQHKVFNDSYKNFQTDVSIKQTLTKNIPIFKNKIKEDLYNDVI